MYQLKPPKVFVADRVYEDARCVDRMNRMLPHLGGSQPLRVTDDELASLINKEHWRPGCMGKIRDLQDPSVIFTTWRWSGEDLGILNRDADQGIYSFDPKQEADAKAMAEKHGRKPTELLRHLMGHGAFEFTHEPGRCKRINRTCRPAIEIHTMDGCPHKCVYCGFGTVMLVMVNVEEFVQRLDTLCELNPWQTVFRYDINGESLALEPEFGATKQLVEYFAGTDRYFLIHSKSANVDHLLDLDHKGHTIALWSLTSETVTRELEKDSAPTHNIIEAARKCQDAGYPVRFKFKPVVPVVGWRQECADMIRQVFERTRPDMLSMCTMWCTLADLKVIMPPGMLDPDCLKACEEGEEEMKQLTQRPFPHKTRAEIYQFILDEIRKWDRDIPVSISTETEEMWREFGPKLGVGSARYVCGCGPQATPGAKRLKLDPYTIAKLRSI